jgi:hypothetical protein
MSTMEEDGHALGQSVQPSIRLIALITRRTKKGDRSERIPPDGRSPGTSGRDPDAAAGDQPGRDLHDELDARPQARMSSTSPSPNEQPH